MGEYAKETSVSVEKSRAEVETILQRYGAAQFAYARDDEQGKCCIEFMAQSRRIRFVLPLPKQNDPKFTHYKNRSKVCRRSDEASRALYDQACRQRWRALVLCIKAKLEAVTSEISEFENEFLANIVDPVTGRTVGDVVRPRLQLSYEGKPQTLLLAAE